jgi:hypothetical protein
MKTQQTETESAYDPNPASTGEPTKAQIEAIENTWPKVPRLSPEIYWHDKAIEYKEKRDQYKAHADKSAKALAAAERLADSNANLIAELERAMNLLIKRPKLRASTANALWSIQSRQRIEFIRDTISKAREALAKWETSKQ